MSFFKKRKEEPERDGSEPVLAATITNHVSSEIYQDMLRENGIPFVCRQEGAGGYLKILLGVGIIPDNIYVAEKNYERAREIYEAYLLTEPPEDDDGDISGE